MAKKPSRAKRSNSYDPVLREIIAWRICDTRQKAYPGRGSLTKCAKAFDMSPQQWAQYESGHRSPESSHLERIAKHLKTTVQALMSPPENWIPVRAKWLASRTRGRKKAPPAEQSNAPVEQVHSSLALAAGHAPSTGAAHGTVPPVVSPSTSHESRILAVIHKVFNADALRSEGKVSADDFASTLKSVEVLMDALCREHIR